MSFKKDWYKNEDPTFSMDLLAIGLVVLITFLFAMLVLGYSMGSNRASLDAQTPPKGQRIALLGTTEIYEKAGQVYQREIE